jgi:hypothetical protein
VRLHLSSSVVSSPVTPRRDTAPHLACEPLKRKAGARGTRALRAPSIVGSFSLRSFLGSADENVALAASLLVLAAARASCAGRHGDGQNGSTRATIPDGPAAGALVEKWPRSVLPEPPLHDARSD